MEFNNEFYHQIKGTGTGLTFLPIYATLSIQYFDIKLCSVCTFKY